MLSRLLIILFLFSPLASAQDEGDDFFEDDSYDEPYEEPAPEIPSPGAPTDDSFAPPPERFRPPPSTRLGNRSPRDGNSNQRNTSPRVSYSGDGSVEFVLVDPPKYWKPKKKKVRPLKK